MGVSASTSGTPSTTRASGSENRLGKALMLVRDAIRAKFKEVWVSMDEWVLNCLVAEGAARSHADMDRDLN